MKVAFVGKMQSGKTSACNYLGLHIIPFAKGVKDAAYDLGWDGKKDKKGRKALQLIGTDVARMLKPNIWVDRWIMNCRDQFSHKLGCDDCRFNNEASMLKANGFTIVHISRPRSLSYWIKEIFTLRILSHFHKSEKGIDTKYIDYYIKAKNLDELYREIDKIKSKLEE